MIDLSAEITPGKSGAGFDIGSSLSDLNELLAYAVKMDTSQVQNLRKLLAASEGFVVITDNSTGEKTVYYGDDIVRLKFNSKGMLYCMYLFEGYKGLFNNCIGIGSKLIDVTKIFPIYYDDHDEMHYPDDECGASVSGIAFYGAEESIDDDPEQVINGISVHDWSLM
jgi:hypothetical protein